MAEKAKEILLTLSKELEVKAKELGSLFQSPSVSTSAPGSSGKVEGV